MFLPRAGALLGSFLTLLTYPGAATLVQHDARFTPDSVLRLSRTDAALACVYRTSVVVNGTTPGPRLTLKENQTTWIRVYNDMDDQNATVHWHGLSQSVAPFSDGTPLVSQWPIPPLHYFDYEIRPKIGEAGSYFYHSHVGYQAVSAAGPLIVEEASGKPPYAYDDERVFFMQDLFNRTDTEIEAGLVARSFVWAGETETILVNGKSARGLNGTGAQNDHPDPPPRPGSPSCGPEVVNVEPDKTYRIRFIAGTALSLVTLGIEGHDNLTIIEADGSYTKPHDVNHIQAGSGQRFDVLLKTKTASEIEKEQKTDYWIQLENRDRPVNVTSYALLSYSMPKTNKKRASPSTEVPKTKPITLPYPVGGWLEYALEPLHPNTFPLAHEVTRRVYLKNLQIFTKPDSKGESYWVDSGHSWRANRTGPPYLVNIYENGQKAIPDLSNAVRNYGGWDPASDTYPAAVGEVIEIILVNMANSADGTNDVHPWHAHGGHYYDIGSGPGMYNATANEEKLANYSPVLRDTTMLYKEDGDVTAKAPKGSVTGWRGWRLRVEDAGTWLVHCHIIAHMGMGMQTVWVMGNADDIVSKGLDESKGYLTYGGSVYGNETFAPTAPMISSPLKQTNEIDWIAPIKAYIRQNYGDDPERYAEECATLNRLRQDMRGAGKDSAAGRDLLYRYYGQLELLDLRFPVDENHIKILFTWFDAFTHKPTSQYSLAFEKASIIFNISAVLSCIAATQNRHEDAGVKVAFHSFQASAGMFTYINENFLHAPSTDLNHDTVRTLISITLAQAQEVFLEKTIRDGKKAGMLAKLAGQAAHLYSQAVEGVQENVNKAVFEKVWLLLTQVKVSHLSSVAQYYQALADNETNSHGVAIARLQHAEKLGKDAIRVANTFPSSAPVNSNLGSETSSILLEMTKKQATNVQEKLAEFIKDNDFIYHQVVPSEASLQAVGKTPAAKATSMSELYQGQDIQRIIGPDIFQKIVPMSVTESASLYDEEKAKMIRAETERVETANGEMAANLDYLKLPGSLNILKGGMDQEMGVDEEFRNWCSDLAGHAPFSQAFSQLAEDKARIVGQLDQSSRKLDMEESVCEKMRSKYGGDWSQQPSSRLTSTLRSDIRNYRGAIDEASTSDAQLSSTFRQYESEFEEMRDAGQSDEVDVLYERAMLKAGAGKGKLATGGTGASEGNLLDDDFDDGSISIADQIANVEELLRKLNLVKRERAQVLKDLKEKVHNDDISQVLILNKKAITSQEHQLFKTELEKFRPHQTRILQANHKQASIMKDLTRTYSDLLQDKRVRSEQSKYESFSRQRNSVMTRYRRVAQAFNDLVAGLMRAQGFYSEMKDTVESLTQNVDTFVNNRKAEGGELLTEIEKGGTNGARGSAEQEHERLRDLMDRMNMDTRRPSEPYNRPPSSTQHSPLPPHPYSNVTVPQTSANYGKAPHMRSPPPQPRYSQEQSAAGRSHKHSSSKSSGYDPNLYGNYSANYGQQPLNSTTSSPPIQTTSPPSAPTYYGQSQQVPPGYVPPPPPSGLPPQQDYGPRSRQSNGQSQATDPWAGLSGWK
ncbi:MAG: bck1-like resistance to osmotic shock [Chrysothrix sp. TS-e1954]|nr:MAG: bck1-like resistance to osmotic shock [Chrysothrix sp. TS-e1954]